MWKDRAPLGWDETDHDADRPGRRGAAVGLLPGDHRRDRPRRRWLPRHGCLTASATARCAGVTSLVELRVLEGPNLYFPRAAIKLTLDITPLAAAPDETRRCGSRAGSACATPGRARRARVPAALRRPRGRPAGPRDRGRVGYRAARRARAPDQRPPPLVWPSRGGTATGPRRWAAAVADGARRAAGRRHRGARSARPPSGSRPPSPGAAPTHDQAEDPGRRGHRHQRQDHDLADDRAHRAHRRASSSAGPTPTASTSTASSSRPATTPGPSGAGRVLAHRAGASSRSPRPPAAASCSRASA